MDRPAHLARDARVVAILANPDLYFSTARRRARVRAAADVHADLERRALDRRNGFRPGARIVATLSAWTSPDRQHS